MDPQAVERVKSKLGAGRRIVVFLHPNIGDVVNLTVVFKWLNQLCPQSILVAVTSPLAADIAKACPYVSEVWTRPRGLFERLAFVKKLRSGRFDLSLHCQGQNTMLRLTVSSGIPVRIGIAGSKLRDKLALSVEWNEGEVEQPGTVGRLLAMLGADVSDQRPQLKIPESATEKAAETLGGRSSVAFMVGASHPAKRWPLERFLEVATAGEKARQIVFLGGPAEAALLEGTKLPPSLNLCGKLNVLESAAVLEKCDLLVTNDSGPMHLAGAMGTPVVAVFGPTSCDRFRPYGEGHTLLQGQCSCPMKDLDSCTGECLRSISVHEVVAAVSANPSRMS